VAVGNVLGVGEARLCGGGCSGALRWRRRRGQGSAVVAQTARAALERNTVVRTLKSDAQSHLAAILAGVLLRTTLGRPQEMRIRLSEASEQETKDSDRHTMVVPTALREAYTRTEREQRRRTASATAGMLAFVDGKGQKATRRCSAPAPVRDAPMLDDAAYVHVSRYGRRRRSLSPTAVPAAEVVCAGAARGRGGS